MVYDFEVNSNISLSFNFYSSEIKGLNVKQIIKYLKNKFKPQ